MFLRVTRQVARTEHWCDRCCTHIMPGDEYERMPQLYVRGGRVRVIVWKHHVNPECDWPEDPDWKENNEEEFKEESLSKAA